MRCLGKSVESANNKRTWCPGMSESPPTAAPSEEQLRELERILQVDPGNLRLFNACASLALRFDDHDALLRAADTRLRLHPTDIPALSARARALLAKGGELAAENVEAAQSDAALAGAYALLYLDLNRIPEASDWAQKALALDPASVGALTV